MQILTEEDVKKRFIEPALTAKGWDFNRISMEKQVYAAHTFTDGKVIVKGRSAKRGTKKRADYLLHHHNNFPIAIIEAKDMQHTVDSGIQQALDYATILDVPFAYSSNGKGFIEHDRLTGCERELAMDQFPTSEELWERYIAANNITPDVEKVIKQPYFYREGFKRPRYYQRIAVNRTVEHIAKLKSEGVNDGRALLVMATGTGKTMTAFHIIHRLYSTGVVKKVLYLADRNILIDQTILGDFAYWKEKGILTKVEKKKLDSSYDIFMSLYHQLSGEEDMETFLQFKPNFFDLIIVDECHRGSAKENSAWRKILDYFDSAIQIGMTATPKETEDVSNSNYFGEPIYTYSLKQGIDDGFLAPYRVLRIGIDKDLEGYIPEKGKIDVYGQEIEQREFTSRDFDRKLIIDDRTTTVAKRITEFLKSTDRYAKTIVFCVDIDHAERMRRALIVENQDLCKINEKYIMKITGDDELGKAQLENFIDNNSKYPTIVTTSELLSTGVDCKMCKVIVLDSVIQSMTKFKQIIGRGTRLVWDRDKRFFTILDFRKATQLFSDPEFDGPATSTYVGGGDPLPTDPGDDTEPEDPIDDIEENNKKYRVNDVDTEIISELELIYGEDGKLIANHTDNFRAMILKGYPTKEEFIAKWMSEDKLELISYFEENGVDIYRLKDRIGFDIDIFDIILLVAYDQDAVLKKERVENVINSSFYAGLDFKLKGPINDLLDIYIQQDIFPIEKEDLSVLELPVFNKYGGFVPTVHLFGGKAKYKTIIKQLIQTIYT